MVDTGYRNTAYRFMQKQVEAGRQCYAVSYTHLYSSLLYKQHIYENTPVFVVGIAKGYDDALYLVEAIAEDIYKKTNDLDIRGYIRRRQKEYEEGRV